MTYPALPPQDSEATTKTITEIAVTTSFLGMHCWPSAPPHRNYLASPHRHKFGVKVSINVTGHDREIEFHDLKDFVGSVLPVGKYVMMTDKRNPYLNFSCEHHATRIAREVRAGYPTRMIRVTVDEDGECEATVTITP